MRHLLLQAQLALPVRLVPLDLPDQLVPLDLLVHKVHKAHKVFKAIQATMVNMEFRVSKDPLGQRVPLDLQDQPALQVRLGQQVPRLLSLDLQDLRVLLVPQVQSQGQRVQLGQQVPRLL